MSDFDPDYWGARIRAAAQVVPKGEAVMGEKMTLEQVRDWHREQANLCRNSIAAYLGDKACGPIAKKHDAMADALDAHITQPAQAVDVDKVREVIAELRNTYTNICHSWADKLTAAIPKDSNGAEGA